MEMLIRTSDDSHNNSIEYLCNLFLKNPPIHALYSCECFMKNSYDFEISNPMKINDFHIQLLSKRYIFTLLHVEDIFQGLVWK